jgi:putative cardiolipin synthase
VYVGSFNVNLRSAFLNAETALVVDSPALAARVAASIDALMAPDSSFRLKQWPDGRIEWSARIEGAEQRWEREPMTGFWRRAGSRFYGLFPLEKYL